MAQPATADQLQQLCTQALAARDRAYAPYSKFQVGAAILAVDGRVFCGANVENSSYGLTLCAERVAASAAVTSGAHQFTAIAIASPEAAAPCGACRQFLYEFGDTTVVLVDAIDPSRVRNVQLSDLLPDGFRFDPADR